MAHGLSWMPVQLGAVVTAARDSHPSSPYMHTEGEICPAATLQGWPHSASKTSPKNLSLAPHKWELSTRFTVGKTGPQKGSLLSVYTPALAARSSLAVHLNPPGLGKATGSAASSCWVAVLRYTAQTKLLQAKTAGGKSSFLNGGMVSASPKGA